ncbi:MAG: hypothetical protein NVS3B26_06220 [Mycobacteriales bacterium]
MTGAIPDQRPVRAGDQLQRLTVIKFTSHRTVVRTVQANDLGQHVRVPCVALRHRRRVPLAVSGSGHRIDREHLVARRDQRRDPRPTFGLNADLHPARNLARVKLGALRRHRHGDQLVQLAESFEPLWYSLLHQPPALTVEDLDVVMAFSPVVAHEQHYSSFHEHLRCQQRGGDTRDRLDKCTP